MEALQKQKEKERLHKEKVKQAIKDLIALVCQGDPDDLEYKEVPRNRRMLIIVRFWKKKSEYGMDVVMR
jgi:hypothetical protein